MKTNFKLAFIIVLMLNAKITFSQISTSVNNGVSTDYVGWDQFQTFPLTIKHEANQPINFYNNAGNSGVPPLGRLRMQIANTTLYANSGSPWQVGRVSILENNLGWANTGAQACALLHLGHGAVPGAAGHRLWMDVGT